MLRGKGALRVHAKAPNPALRKKKPWAAGAVDDVTMASHAMEA